MYKSIADKLVNWLIKISNKDPLNLPLRNGIIFGFIFTLLKDWNLIMIAFENNNEEWKQVLQNFLRAFSLIASVILIFITIILPFIYEKLVPENILNNNNVPNWEKYSCSKTEIKHKTQNQIITEISSLIDDLELSYIKEKWLDYLQFNYRLKCFDDEDYTQLGNSRLGGLPDLPEDVNYPYNEEGYYDLLCQINFAEFDNKLGKLPVNGILYIFNGYPSENDYFTFFTKSTENLVKKQPPIGMNSLNRETLQPYYDGLKVMFELEHLLSESLYEEYKMDRNKFNKLIDSNSPFKSHILGHSLDDLSSIYLTLKGFDTIKYESLLDLEIKEHYKERYQRCLNECETAPQGIYHVDYVKKKEQLLKFDKEKEFHFTNHKKVTCLIGLESLDRLGWCWGDAGFKYVYILDEDLENEDFSNLLVETWSS